MDLEKLVEKLRLRLPDVDFDDCTLNHLGWDNQSIETKSGHIIRVPRDAAKAKLLRREVILVDFLNNSPMSIPIPQLKLYEGDPPFSIHKKLAGVHILKEILETLTPADKACLGRQLAEFIFELHNRVSLEMAQSLGFEKCWDFKSKTQILDKLNVLLSATEKKQIELLYEQISRYRERSELTRFLHNDIHDWNSVIDPATKRFTAIFDFGDAGIGDLHREFVQMAWLGLEIQLSCISHYSNISALKIDLPTIYMLSRLNLLDIIYNRFGSEIPGSEQIIDDARIIFQDISERC